MQELKEKGNEAFKKGDHQEAYNLYSKALELADSEPDRSGLHLVYSNRAATLLTLERYEEALADCEKVLELDPKFIKGFLRKAMALRALGRKREALDVAKAGLAIDQNPKAVGVPELTKLAYAIQGDLKPKVTKRSQKETEELVKDYNDVVAEVEQLNYELETRDREVRSMKLTLDYVNQVKENTGAIPNTYLPVGRMFVRKPAATMVNELDENIKETTNEFETLREKMRQNEIKLKSLSGELEEIMRANQ
jgi:tetratricopeptide (TPR) repeat protein